MGLDNTFIIETDDNVPSVGQFYGNGQLIIRTELLNIVSRHEKESQGENDRGYRQQFTYTVKIVTGTIRDIPRTSKPQQNND